MFVTVVVVVRELEPFEPPWRKLLFVPLEVETPFVMRVLDSMPFKREPAVVPLVGRTLLLL